MMWKIVGKNNDVRVHVCVHEKLCEKNEMRERVCVSVENKVLSSYMMHLNACMRRWIGASIRVLCVCMCVCVWEREGVCVCLMCVCVS